MRASALTPLPVSSLILKLLSPFQARNSEVRSNAALLFVEAFPIRHPGFNAIEMDSEIQKQFEELYVCIHVAGLPACSGLGLDVPGAAPGDLQRAIFPDPDVLPGTRPLPVPSVAARTRRVCFLFLSVSFGPSRHLLCVV